MNDGERRRGRRKEKRGTGRESERGERKSERPGDGGGEEDGKRVTHMESGPSGQFRGTINDKPTEEEGEWNAFLRVYRDIFRACITTLTLTLEL